MTQILNKPQNVRNASEKIRTFTILQAELGNYLPEWTTQRNIAEGWLITPIYGNKKNAVLCRTLTRANSGRGIVLASTVEEIAPALLYTRYKPKTAEYRVHVFTQLGIIDVQQKRRRNDVERAATSSYIRSHDNGWVFCRDDIIVPDSVRTAAERAVNVLGLDFGAVDIGYDPTYGIAIYEVNTAPGLEGLTLNNYVNAFRSYINS
jgi:hypothetical protein